MNRNAYFAAVAAAATTHGVEMTAADAESLLGEAWDTAQTLAATQEEFSAAVYDAGTKLVATLVRLKG